jgi:hypothetical protein
MNSAYKQMSDNAVVVEEDEDEIIFDYMKNVAVAVCLEMCNYLLTSETRVWSMFLCCKWQRQLLSKVASRDVSEDGTIDEKDSSCLLVFHGSKCSMTTVLCSASVMTTIEKGTFPMSMEESRESIVAIDWSMWPKRDHYDNHWNWSFEERYDENRTFEDSCSNA